MWASFQSSLKKPGKGKAQSLICGCVVVFLTASPVVSKPMITAELLERTAGVDSRSITLTNKSN